MSKRLIGLPGDTIEIVGNTVYRNGEALEEAYLTDETQRQPVLCQYGRTCTRRG